MIEVHPRLWVGNDEDAERVIIGTKPQGVALNGIPYEHDPIWAMVSAAKEPYHRAMVGYTTRGAPDGPNRYAVRSGRHLALNWVDVDDARWFREVELREAMIHICAAQRMEVDCLVHCNQGVSRSPALVLGWLHLYGGEEWETLSFDRAEEKLRAVYPAYDPTLGVREFVRETLW